MKCEHGHRRPGGGAVDGARGEVNDTIHQRGLHLLWVRCLAIPKYEKGECNVFLRWSFKTKQKQKNDTSSLLFQLLLLLFPYFKDNFEYHTIKP